MLEASRTDPACILTIEAASPGGVPALVDTVYALLQGWGEEPTVYRARFAEGSLSFWQRLLLTLRTWQPQVIEERGLRTVVVPAPPVPLWLFYAVPHFLFGPLIGQHRAAFVVSGSAHVALPLALRGIPYTLWVATRYEDELQAKADAGDGWAQSVLSSPTWRILEAQERFVLRRASRILALSYHTAERLADLTPDITARMETVLFPVDTRRFRPDPEAWQRLPYGDYLLLAARINDPRKNVALLLRAFARLRAQHPALRLVLVGEEPGEAVREEVRRLGVEDAVVFGGIVSADELLALYQGAQLFVLPSLQEGLGIVVLEALACGTPVVTTRCGGPEGIVIDGETGRVVDDPHNPEQMAAAIHDLLSSPERLSAMRERCAAFAAGHFAYPIVAARLQAAHRQTQVEPAPQSGRRDLAAALWAVFVLGAYLVTQLIIHWPSIQSRIIGPLLADAP